MVGPNGYITRMNDRHEVEWVPPVGLETGQARINYYHRPELLLRPPEDPQPPPDNDIGAYAPVEPIGDGGCGEPEPIDPVGNDDADQPGGPAPPDDQAA